MVWCQAILKFCSGAMLAQTPSKRKKKKNELPARESDRMGEGWQVGNSMVYLTQDLSDWMNMALQEFQTVKKPLYIKDIQAAWRCK